MFIPYSKIFHSISILLPIKYRKNIKDFGIFLEKKIAFNHTKKYKKVVLKKIKEKLKNNEKINVAFLTYDEKKWKAQSVYELLEKDEHFYPYIVITKIDVSEESPNAMKPEEVENAYNFFKNKKMNVIYAYNNENKEFIPLSEIDPKPDIVMYCQSWDVNKNQYPKIVNKFALTGYLPYSVPASSWWQEYATDFHEDVEQFYVIDELIRKHYASNMKNRGINLKVVGHPMLDYFYLNKNKTFENKKYVIYAPHFSLGNETILKWGTFHKIGEFVLEYAKAHPELVWIFRPHPVLEGYLIKRNYWTQEKYDNYIKEWKTVGFISNSGNYLDIFMESTAMITDCGSFKTEYFMTKKPQFYPLSENSTPFNSTVEEINKTSYISRNTEELKCNLDEVLINGNDYKREERIKLYNKLKLADNYSALNIVNDIKRMAGIND